MSKIVHEWNSHLENLSLPKLIENSKQYLLLRTDILQKTMVGFPWIFLLKRYLTPRAESPEGELITLTSISNFRDEQSF